MRDARRGAVERSRTFSGMFSQHSRGGAPRGAHPARAGKSWNKPLLALSIVLALTTLYEGDSGTPHVHGLATLAYACEGGGAGPFALLLNLRGPPGLHTRATPRSQRGKRRRTLNLRGPCRP
jgi:hypothetical protein